MKIFTLAIAIIISTPLMSQSPWVPQLKSGYVQLGFTTIGNYGSIYLDGNNDYRLNREVTDNTIQLYGEYGLADNLGLSIVIPYKLMSTGSFVNSPTNPALLNIQGDHSALGNIELALKRNFINSSFLLSGQVKTELPTSSLDDATGLRTGLDALTITPSVSIGKGSAKYYGFAAVGSGLRTNDYSSDFRLSAEVGAKEFDKLWVVLVLDVVQSFDNGSAVGEKIEQSATGTYLNNQEYFAYGLKGILEINQNLGINGAFYGAASGNLVAKAPSINFGAYWKW